MTEEIQEENSNEKGSLWQKWDLHIHSPLSFLENQFDNDWENWISKIKTEQIKVIGLTNYFRFNHISEQSEIDFVREKLKDTGIVVFPNLEFRLSQPNKEGEYINLHILFSEQVTTKRIEAFLSRLKLDDDTYCSDLNTDADFKGATISKKELENKLKEDFERYEDYLVVCCPNGYGGFRADNREGRSVKVATLFDKLADFFFARPQDRDYFLTDNRYENSIPKAVVFCSDAHKVDEIGGEKFTWVKADRTFDGLKQIMYEPFGRIKLQVDNPDFEFDKPVFDSIEINSITPILNVENSNLQFNVRKIPLNRNLVSIIGGRGKGKSMLINYIGKGYGKEINSRLDEKIILNESFTINWLQSFESQINNYHSLENRELPFTFIYQSKIKEIAEDYEELKKEVIEILKGAGYKKPDNQYNEIETKEKLQTYLNIKNWLSDKNEDGTLKNDKSKLLRRIDSINDNINLAADINNKEQLEKYIENLSKIEKHNTEIVKLTTLKEEIVTFKTRINVSLSDLQITQITTDIQEQEIDSKIQDLRTNITVALEENENIKTEKFKDFKGDLSQILNNLESYKNEIAELNKKIGYIIEKEQELINSRVAINQVLESHKNKLALELNSINETWQNKIFNNPNRGSKENELIKSILDKRGIKIQSEIFFNRNQFSHSAQKCINGQVIKSKQDRVFDLLRTGDNIPQSILDITFEKLEEIIETSPGAFWGDLDNHLANIFLSNELRDKYIFVRPTITLDDTPLEDLSAGQKGTIYLCLKLATQTFGGPLIFDQPEDDLDNEFINEELIKLFTEIKEFRQIIIVSHNANLVVNADSEQVIIANNNSGLLTYDSGSLENETINKRICKILEGGKTAFEKRRNKYKEIK